MPIISLPDGSQRRFDDAVTVAQIAAAIGPGLAKAAIAGRVNGKLLDLSRTVSEDAEVAIVTDRDPDGLHIIRHSTAHLMAYAVQDLFPEAQVTIGPVIENGFYYDFAYKRPFTPEDLAAIEKRMHELAALDEAVVREEWDRQEAVKYFESVGEKYKAEIIASIPPEEEITFYREGRFVDLCRGPHVPSTGKLKVFKLMKVAGAYWRGDASNEMLQRIYGTAWAKKDEQDAYLHMLEEAEKRDHRRLGKELDLFHTQAEAPGMVFWHPRGWVIWQRIEQYIRDLYRESGYQEVRCPQILDVDLWKRSGHWDNYKENMFFCESEKREYAVKPMNCPGHVQLFNASLRSYRDLPLRYAEFGSCHRNEPSGALHGIMRVRGFTQDDGHIFCTEDQVAAEVTAFHRQAMDVYRDFGFGQVAVKLALRPDQRLGTDDAWDRAENALRAALSACDVKWEELPGEGAFYGPKIEYHLKDSIGRAWQVGTIQYDPMMPERLNAEYVAEDNSRRRPIMLHRAIVGSMERFIGILIENHAGAMPPWLAPVQVSVLSVTDSAADYAEDIRQRLLKQGFRVVSDLRSDKIGYKIREHSLQKIPYLVVVGERDRQAGTLAVRARGGKDLGSMRFEDFASLLARQVAEKAH